MTLANDFLEMVDKIAATVDLPAIRSVHVAGYQEQPQKSSKFGALVLEDDSVGVTYMDMDNALLDLSKNQERLQLAGKSPVEVCHLFSADSGWQRCLGMAAINAISQHIFSRSNFALLEESDRTVSYVGVEADDHIGMVGFFPPLVEQVREIGARLTVIELDNQWIQQSDMLEVTLDPRKLSSCNKIICTGTTLINHTLDELLAHSTSSSSFHIIGPTVGCLPDPLFKLGVTAIGGLRVVNRDRFIRLWKNQERWRDAAVRYEIKHDHYPGLNNLLRTLG